MHALFCGVGVFTMEAPSLVTESWKNCPFGLFINKVSPEETVFTRMVKPLAEGYNKHGRSLGVKGILI